MIIKVNDTELFVTRAKPSAPTQQPGRIPALVMHGGLGFDQSYLRPWFDPLADALDLIYFDQRGNGRSAQPQDWRSVTHATWVQDTDALRAELGLERVLLIGHSYGAFLALEYAIQHPERLLGLVLCSGAPVLDYFETAVANARARATDAQFSALMDAMVSAPPRTDVEMRAGMETVLPIYLHDPTSSLGPDLMRDVRYSRDAFVHAFAHCLPLYDVRAGLHQITAPTLIVSGVDDWITPPEQGGVRLQRGIPNAEHIVFASSGHFPFAEEPEAFQAMMRTWLARCVAADTSR